MNVLILEDNEVARNALVKIVKSCMNQIQVFAFANRGEAYLCAMDKNIDLFLVDIILNPKERNDTSGIRFANDLRDNIRYKAKPIIFITTLSGLEGALLRQVHCYDYIEKPIDALRVRRRILEALDAIVSERKMKKPEQLSLRYDGVNFPVVIDEIIYMVSRRGVLYIYGVEDRIEIPNLPMSTFLSRIRDNHFLIPIKGTAVNARYIRSVDFSQNKVYLKRTKDVVDIGGRMKKRFREEFEECFRLIN